MQFLQRWLVTTVAVLVAAHVVAGIHYTGFPALLVASLVLGLVNAFVRPVLLLVSISFVVATLGLGVLVINALLLWGVGSLGTGFRVDGFGPHFGAVWSSASSRSSRISSWVGVPGSPCKGAGAATAIPDRPAATSSTSDPPEPAR